MNGGEESGRERSGVHATPGDISLGLLLTAVVLCGFAVGHDGGLEARAISWLRGAAALRFGIAGCLAAIGGIGLAYLAYTTWLLGSLAWGCGVFLDDHRIR